MLSGCFPINVADSFRERINGSFLTSCHSAAKKQKLSHCYMSRAIAHCLTPIESYVKLLSIGKTTQQNDAIALSQPVLYSAQFFLFLFHSNYFCHCQFSVVLPVWAKSTYRVLNTSSGLSVEWWKPNLGQISKPAKILPSLTCF